MPYNPWKGLLSSTGQYLQPVASWHLKALVPGSLGASYVFVIEVSSLSSSSLRTGAVTSLLLFVFTVGYLRTSFIANQQHFEQIPSAQITYMVFVY